MPDPLERAKTPFQTAIKSISTGATRLAASLFRVAIYPWLEPLARRWVERRLQNYKVKVHTPDTMRPVRLPEGTAHHVAVIGGGLAGIAAATLLAERGVQVTLYEAEPYLGGKLGAWTEDLGADEPLRMEHGFHAFFANYYNLNRFLERLGIEQGFADITDYMILTRDGGSMSFAGTHPTPLLNLFDLAARGMFDWRELVIGNPGLRRLDDLLTFDPVETRQRLDDESYEDFARAAHIPARLRLIFDSFARAFFAESHQMSMAEMIKSFHGYYLSHDGGLIYRYPTDDHAITLWDPIRAHLEAHGVSIQLGKPVPEIQRQKNGRLRVRGRPYDDVVLAVDSRSALRILAASELDGLDPLRSDLAQIQPVNRYANLRIWIDRDVRDNIPMFTVTETIRALDSVTTCHRAQGTWRAWTDAHGGAVIELHAYCIPADLTTDEAVRAALLADFEAFFPEVRGYRIVHETMYIKDDFSAFHVGMAQHRPTSTTPLPDLHLAGDWVASPWPVMLMEASFTTGAVCANTILDRLGVRTEPLYSVPSRGILHGLR